MKNLYNNCQKENLILRDCLAVHRTSLANERTFLAYIRTALALLITGVSFIELLKHFIMLIIGWFFIAIAIITGITGIVSYIRNKKALFNIEKLDKQSDNSQGL